MKLKISMHDKIILLMFFGIVFFAAGYVFGYRPQMEKAEAFQAESVSVREHLDRLLKMAEKKEYYVKETSSMRKKIEDYMAQFPADIKEEDGILLASAMENSLDMKASSVGLGAKEFVAAMELTEYLASQNGRMTIDSVNASFDPTTGNLTGTLTVDLFSMTGTSNSYTKPDAGSVAHGTGNLFGTIENAEAGK